MVEEAIEVDELNDVHIYICSHNKIMDKRRTAISWRRQLRWMSPRLFPYMLSLPQENHANK